MNRRHKKLVKETLKMNKCRYCRAKENLTIDHKIPIARGGTDELNNLQCLCMRCNGIKSSVTDSEIKRIVRWWLEIKGFEHKHLKPICK